MPLIGAIGSISFFGLMLWHLYQAERSTFYAVLDIAGAILVVELFYFERTAIEEEIEQAERWIESTTDL